MTRHLIHHLDRGLGGLLCVLLLVTLLPPDAEDEDDHDVSSPPLGRRDVKLRRATTDIDSPGGATWGFGPRKACPTSSSTSSSVGGLETTQKASQVPPTLNGGSDRIWRTIAAGSPPSGLQPDMCLSPKSLSAFDFAVWIFHAEPDIL